MLKKLQLQPAGCSGKVIAERFAAGNLGGWFKARLRFGFLGTRAASVLKLELSWV